MDLKNPLDAVPRQITGAIGDIRKIAESVQSLPRLVEILADVRDRTESLDDEVKKMRAEVTGINEKVDELEDNLERLPEKLDELSKTLHPLRRTFARFGRSEDERPAEDN